MPKKLTLEQKIEKRLEWTGLTENVKLHIEDYDSYKTPGKPLGEENKKRIPYISLKISKNQNSRTCEQLRDYLLEKLRHSKPEIVGISYSLDRENRELNAHLSLNPESSIANNKEFIKETLNAINTALKDYLYKNTLPDPLRN
jgi:hypothetical protein